MEIKMRKVYDSMVNLLTKLKSNKERAIKMIYNSMVSLLNRIKANKERAIKMIYNTMVNLLNRIKANRIVIVERIKDLSSFIILILVIALLYMIRDINIIDTIIEFIMRRLGLFFDIDVDYFFEWLKTHGPKKVKTEPTEPQENEQVLENPNMHKRIVKACVKWFIIGVVYTLLCHVPEVEIHGWIQQIKDWFDKD
jgi:hypothetical protein